MVNIWKQTEDALTRDLIRNEGNTEDVIRYDLSGVVQLQEDVTSLIERTLKEFTAGAITRNEYREKAGYDELEGKSKLHGDVFVMPINMVEIPVDGDGMLDEELNTDPKQWEDGK